MKCRLLASDLLSYCDAGEGTYGCISVDGELEGVPMPPDMGCFHSGGDSSISCCPFAIP
jgi:hypothetical protein